MSMKANFSIHVLVRLKMLGWFVGHTIADKGGAGQAGSDDIPDWSRSVPNVVYYYRLLTVTTSAHTCVEVA